MRAEADHRLMRTLLVESSPGAGAAAEAELARAGVEVLRCSERAAPAFPCREVTEWGSCPLAGSTRPDLVLVARASTDKEATIAEAGVSCALRHGVPVLVEHDPALGTNPFGDLVDVAKEGVDRLAACEETVSAAHDREVAPLIEEVVRLLQVSGATDVAVTVSLVRQGGSCQVSVTIPADAEVSDEAVAVRVHDRLRLAHGDGQPSNVDVGVRRRQP